MYIIMVLAYTKGPFRMLLVPDMVRSHATFELRMWKAIIFSVEHAQ